MDAIIELPITLGIPINPVGDTSHTPLELSKDQQSWKGSYKEGETIKSESSIHIGLGYSWIRGTIKYGALWSGNLGYGETITTNSDDSNRWLTITCGRYDIYYTAYFYFPYTDGGYGTYFFDTYYSIKVYP